MKNFIPLRIDDKRGQCGGFNVLEEIDKTNIRHPNFKATRKRIYYSCQCIVCGLESARLKESIIRGNIRCPCHHYYNKLKKTAIKRKIQFSITAEYMWNMLKQQDYSCALTGRDIYFNSERDKTVSLDRIDSSKGYIKNNIQWLHKEINMFKHKWGQEKFISMCYEVAEHRGLYNVQF